MSEAFKCDTCKQYFDGKPARVFTPEWFIRTGDKHWQGTGVYERFDVCKNCDKVEEVEE